MWRAHGEHWTIMKKVDVSLWHMLDIVATCIVLCNICTTGNGGFNKGWIKEVEFFYESEPKKKTLSKGQELKSEKATIVEIRVKIHPKQKM